MSGLGLSIFGIIRACTSELYPATLLIRVYFIACIGIFYAMTRDPLFLLLAGIVGTWFRSDVGLVPRGSKEVVSIPVTTCYKVGWASAAANELGIARSYHLNWRRSRAMAGVSYPGRVEAVPPAAEETALGARDPDRLRRC